MANKENVKKVVASKNQERQQIMTSKNINEMSQLAISNNYELDLLEKNIQKYENKNKQYGIDLTRTDGVKQELIISDEKEKFKMSVDEEAFLSSVVTKMSKTATKKVGIETAKLFHTLRYKLFIGQFEEDENGNGKIEMSIDDYIKFTNTPIANKQRKLEFRRNLERDLMFLGSITMYFREETKSLIRGGRCSLASNGEFYTIGKGKNGTFSFRCSPEFMAIHKQLLKGNYQFQDKRILSLDEKSYLTAIKLCSHKANNQAKNNQYKNKLKVETILKFNLNLKNKKDYERLKDKSHYYKDIIEPFINAMNNSDFIVKKWRFSKHEKTKGSFKNAQEFFDETIIVEEWADNTSSESEA